MRSTVLLPDPAGTEQRGDLALVRGEADVIDGLELAEALRQMPSTTIGVLIAVSFLPPAMA